MWGVGGLCTRVYSAGCTAVQINSPVGIHALVGTLTDLLRFISQHNDHLRLQNGVFIAENCPLIGAITKLKCD